jgi:hypothetical protein
MKIVFTISYIRSVLLTEISPDDFDLQKREGKRKSD